MGIKQKPVKNNVGRPPKYNEKTRPISFAVPLSKVEEVRKFVASLLKSYEV
jgi:hypothetical protein